MAPRSASKWLEVWNRKLHIYFGLYMLLFLWLFSISGLFMNHPNWFPHRGQRSMSEEHVQIPSEGSDLEKAINLREQLGLRGEILLRRAPPKKGRFNFTVIRPNGSTFVEVDLESQLAAVRFNAAEPLAVLESLHVFSGVRNSYREEAPVRDWLATQVWSFSMDALSVGLIFLVISSFYMWYLIKDKRAWGMLAAVLGFASCSYFIWGL